jgi:2'-5' RNA ligase
MDQSSLYFVALTPEASFTSFIRTRQLEMCDLFGVCRALRTPPHVTLVPPFRCIEDYKKDLQNALSETNFEPFDLPMIGMGKFGKRVIFIKPEINGELKRLHTATQIAYNPWSKPEEQPFHPHFTIGYRNLEPVFDEAWVYFQEVKIPPVAKMVKVALFKHLNKRWQILSENF